MFLIAIIISILLVTWWIKMANNYAYSDITGKKIKVPNAVKNSTLCRLLNPNPQCSFYGSFTYRNKLHRI